VFFDLHSLHPDEQDRAYVLVHLMKPEVDMTRWRAFLRDVSDQCAGGIDRGITVAAINEDCLVGLYTWATQPSLDHEKVFSVDNFIATGAIDPEPLFDAMIEKMDEEARKLGCGAVQVSLPSVYTGKKQQRLLVDCFTTQGFIVADQKLRRYCERVDEVSGKRGRAPKAKSPGALH